MSIATFSPLGYMGELGNQMFQIAATIGYARKHGKVPVFPEWKCKISGRSYTSDIFKGPIDQTFNPQTTPLNNRHTYNELSYIDIPFMQGNVDLVGYFQSEKYFESSHDEIRKVFQPHDSVREYIENKYQHILSEKNKISLHMRTGRRGSNDYDVHSTPDYEFVEKSQTHFDDHLYVVFADNMEFAKTLLPANRKYVFIENESNYVDLFFMTYFDSYIVADSTFGWWGAWLSQNENPKVAMMKNWFDPTKEKAYLNDNDIIPDRWIKIDGHFNNRK